MTEVKERIVDLNVERTGVSDELEEPKIKEENEEEKKEGFWDFFRRYPPLVPFFLHY
jgi:hypothetical protein